MLLLFLLPLLKLSELILVSECTAASDSVILGTLSLYVMEQQQWGLCKHISIGSTTAHETTAAMSAKHEIVSEIE